jgi:NitT/TauT family transport system substrate-binding protein
MTLSMISAGSRTPFLRCSFLRCPWQSLRSFGASIGLLVSVLFVSGCDSSSSKTTTVAEKSGSTTVSAGKATEAGATEGSANPGKMTKVSLLLNWYPEAEHGGFYAAKVHGIFEKYGLDVEIQPGGKTTVVPQTLTLGRVQFGIANADDVLVARNQDIPLVALMAPIQQGPRCIMVRADSGIKSFEEFKNLTFQVDSTRPYVPFLRSKGLLDDSVKLAPYFGSVAQLVAGPGYAAQGYTFSEPFMAKQQGVEVTQLMMSDIGYNPYASLLVTTESYLKDHQDICRNMIKASIEGWQKYLADPTASNEVILKNNKQGLERDALVYGVEALKPLCMVHGDLAGVGQMTRERWVELSDTLVDLKLIDRAKVNVDASYSKDLLQ